jgi:surface antigen
MMKLSYRAAPSRREAFRAAMRLGVVGLALKLGACSFAIPSLVPGPEETTGSIPKKIEARLSPDMAGEDWRRAKGALALALDPQGNGKPVKWENPESKAAGEITADGSPFVVSDEICRRFKAVIDMPSGKSSALEGSACRMAADEWAIKDVRAAK